MLVGSSKILTPSNPLYSSVFNDELLIARRWLMVCILFQLIIWTILPALLVHGAYVDVLENWEWGRHFQWGYDKDPFLAAWLTYWLLHWTKEAIWTTYLVSQISVITAFIATWKLAKQFLSPLHALISVSLLSTIFFFNIGATELNDDVLQIGLWALTILFFYKAIKEQKTFQWLLVGLFAALASMDKYFTLMLLLPMLGFLIFNKRARESFKKTGLYLGIFIFLILVIPNFIWLITHSFVAINYALDSASFTKSAFVSGLEHITNPLTFIISMLVVVLLLIIPLIISFGIKQKLNIAINKDDKQFLLFMFFGPFVCILLFLIFTGAKFRFVWATPLFNLAGIILILWLRPALKLANLRKYFIVITTFVAIWIVAYIYNESVSPFFRHDMKHRFELYPGKEIGQVLTQAWNNRYHTPLSYVAGDREAVIYVTYFSPEHPVGYFDWNPNNSQWIDEKDLKKRGGIFVWNNNDNKISASLPAEIRARFPNATTANVYSFNYSFARWITRWVSFKEPSPLNLGVAFLPPSSEALTLSKDIRLQ